VAQILHRPSPSSLEGSDPQFEGPCVSQGNAAWARPRLPPVGLRPTKTIELRGGL